MKSILTVLLCLLMTGCVTGGPYKQPPPKETTTFDFPVQHVNAIISYDLEDIRNTTYCLIKGSINNYGQDNYQLIRIDFDIYSNSKELLGTAYLQLGSGLIAGGKANVSGNLHSSGGGLMHSCPSGSVQSRIMVRLKPA